MTISHRFALVVAAATFSLGITLAPAVFAADPGKTDAMSHSTMSKDTMGKDAMGKDAMKKDAMGKDTMGKDGMKKDETTK